EMTDHESLESERPQAFAALIRWVHSGGNLWVDRVGGDWEELPKLTELLGWNDSDRQTEPRIPTLEDPPGIGSWDALVLSPQDPAILGEEARQRDFAIVSFAQAGELLESLRSLAPTLTDEWCAIRVLGWGTVGAFRDDWFETPANITGRHQELASQFWIGRSWLDR